ncbi:MAG: hypothetical protein LH702_37435 [Phormidesmis sp. CAN_BIN44]|nr:hypothetical protein [Phormidesmis sp. CAN_BIN44]
MKLAISNIAWTSELDNEMLSRLQGNVAAIEIAPTRLWSDWQFSEVDVADCLKTLQHHDLVCSSLQAIVFGRPDLKLFGTPGQRFALIEHLIGAFLNVLYSVWAVLVNIFKSNIAEGWTTLSIQNSIMFFILFTILAILSEYTSRLMMTNQNRPFYIITKESRSLVLTRKQQINVVNSRDKIAADNEETDPSE